MTQWSEAQHATAGLRRPPDVVEGKYVENLQTGLTVCDDGQINEGEECLTQYADGENKMP